MLRYFSLVWLVLAVGCFIGQDRELGVPISPMSDDALFAAFAKTDAWTASEFIRHLQEKGDFRSITRIHESDLPGSDAATYVVAERLGVSELIALCHRYPLASVKWLAAFSSIKNHPKDSVMPYILEMIACDIPKARNACYRACASKKWTELMEFAKQDSNSTAIVVTINAFGDDTLGMTAREYIGACERTQFDERLPTANSPRETPTVVSR